MSEETTVQSNDNAVNNPSTEGSKNNDVPYDRFQEVNSQKNDYKSQVSDLQSELDKFRADQESARQKQLEKNGEYKTLLEEANAKLEKSSVVVKEYEEYKSNKRNSLMETLTEDTDKSRLKSQFNGMSKFEFNHNDIKAFEILGSTVGLRWTKIQEKFKKLVKKFHPDMNSGNKKYEEKLKIITLAYTQLKNTYRKKIDS